MIVTGKVILNNLMNNGRMKFVYKTLLISIASLILVSCAVESYKRLTSGYEEVDDPIDIYYEGKLFRLIDNPKKGSALVAEGGTKEAVNIIISGFFLNLVDTRVPASQFEGAMNNYLNEYKSEKCKITRSNFISNAGTGGYEIFYECS